MKKQNCKQSRTRKLLELFFTFIKIGAFTFGGGYAMIPLIQRETVVNRGWISDEDLIDIIAIAESTPGPIAINSATFVGYRTGGFWGALLATLGVVLPSFIIITAISYILRQFQNIRAVQYAFWGLRAGVLALILKALWSMYTQCPKNILAYILAASAFTAVAVFDISVLIVIASCAVIGLISAIIAERRSGT